MTRTVNWLEEEGYVARRRADSDGRQVLVSLSDTGRAVVLADRARRDAWLARRLRDLTPERARRAAPGRSRSSKTSPRRTDPPL